MHSNYAPKKVPFAPRLNADWIGRNRQNAKTATDCVPHGTYFYRSWDNLTLQLHRLVSHRLTASNQLTDTQRNGASQ